MEPLGKQSSSFQTKSRHRICHSVDTSCCHYISSCIKKPFNAQRKKWWSFKKFSTNAAILQGTTPQPNCSNAALTRQFNGFPDKKRKVLAVAVASMAAAEAAIIAAEAAAHVAHLTLTPANHSRGNVRAETVAAIKIQSAFRGYAVRKTLRVASKPGHELVQARQARVQPCKHQLSVKEWPIDTRTYMRDTSKEMCPECVATPVDTKQLTDEEMQNILPPKLHWNRQVLWMPTRLHGSLNCHPNKCVRNSSPQQTQPEPTRVYAPEWTLQPSCQVLYQKSRSASSYARGDMQSVASFSGMPNYMADTESKRAKIRAHSVPRQHIAARCIPLRSRSPQQQQPSHHSLSYPRHLSHMTHSGHHHASTKRRL